MATLADLRTRLLRTMGLSGAVPSTDVNGQALDSLNDALIGLARMRKWYWWLTEDDTTLASLAASTETSDMPADLGRIEFILDSDANPLEAKTHTRQRKYPEGIGNGSKQTYAIGGVNSTTRAKTVLWSPPVLDGGDYVLWYYRIPVLLASDIDEPDLPDEFHDYLYWRALVMLYIGDEERTTIVNQARTEAQLILKSMEQDHARVIETLTRRIFVTV